LMVVGFLFGVGLLLAGAGFSAEFGEEAAGEAESFFGWVELGGRGEGA
jgi:hypothetical protein